MDIGRNRSMSLADADDFDDMWDVESADSTQTSKDGGSPRSSYSANEAIEQDGSDAAQKNERHLEQVEESIRNKRVAGPKPARILKLDPEMCL